MPIPRRRAHQPYLDDDPGADRGTIRGVPGQLSRLPVKQSFDASTNSSRTLDRTGASHRGSRQCFRRRDRRYRTPYNALPSVARAKVPQPLLNSHRLGTC